MAKKFFRNDIIIFKHDTHIIFTLIIRSLDKQTKYINADQIINFNITKIKITNFKNLIDFYKTHNIIITLQRCRYSKIGEYLNV